MTNLQKHLLIDCGAVFVILLIGGITLTLQDNSKPSSIHHPSSPSASATTKNSSHRTTSPSPPSTDTAPQPSPSSGVPNNTACKLLTLAAARQVLGDTAQYIAPADPTISQPSGTSLSACAYRGQTGDMQMIVRTAQNPLGASQNATVFGSEKPSGVVTLTGYGQSAYWNPQTTQLHILSSNDWYIITSSQGTQAGAEAVAHAVVGGF